MSGQKITCYPSRIKVRIDNCELDHEFLCTQTLMAGYDLLMGIDLIFKLGGITIRNGKATFASESENQGKTAVLACVQDTDGELLIEDVDFTARFDKGHWTVAWKWKADPPTLSNRCPNYNIDKSSVEEFDKEVRDWINRGWLVQTNDNGACVPLMAIVQPKKDKVRPVMDYRELNQYVQSHTGESQTCADVMKRWRKMGTSLSTIDLRRAYLQIHVSPELQRFQLVKFKGVTYKLTRLGFGLSVAPRIMRRIMKNVLEQRNDVKNGCDFYFDDIIIDESRVRPSIVYEHLRRYGLDPKPPQTINNSKVLGLSIEKRKGSLYWKQGDDLPDHERVRTRRELFSWCGRVVGHYPVCRWLRPCTSYIKRHEGTGSWDAPIQETTKRMLSEMVTRMTASNPIGGKWTVRAQADEAVVWCDASSIALGACLEVEGEIVEDAAWLRKKEDAHHINISELEAVVKGINMALSWNVRKLTIRSDSATVASWLRSAIFKEDPLRVSGLSSALVKRRLQIISESISDYGLQTSVNHVSGRRNRADELTRVPNGWLTHKPKDNKLVCTVDSQSNVVKHIHDLHHMGVERTLFLLKEMEPDRQFSRKDVEAIISKCPQCLSIDPSPVRWPSGDLSVDETWQRVACDVTHYDGSLFLTFIDCGPSRFTIWKRINSEGLQVIWQTMEELFLERKWPQEVLLDNSATFKSPQVAVGFSRWGTKVIYRCANRPQGNGIVERCHRTVKRIAARSRISIAEAVYWLNSSTDSGRRELTPANIIYNYPRSTHRQDLDHAELNNTTQPKWTVGQKVFVKPQVCRCTTRWPVGRVTDPTEMHGAIEVDGVRQHVSRIRPCPEEDQAECRPSIQEETPRESEPWKSQRIKRPPGWLQGYQWSRDQGGM